MVQVSDRFVLVILEERGAIDEVVAAIETVSSGVDAVVLDRREDPLTYLREHDLAGVVAQDRPGEAARVELLRGIRAIEPRIPVVLCDDDPDAERISEALEDGATGYVDLTLESASEEIAERLDEAMTSTAAVTSITESGAQFESIVRTTSDVVITVDTESTIQFVNPAVESVLGYAPEELIGQPFTAIMSDELAQRHKRGIRRYLQTGEQRLDWEYIELKGSHKNGHEVPLSVSFSEFTEDDQRYFTGIVRDITDHKRREQRLERYDAIMQTIDDGVYALDANDRFIAVNEAYASLVGYDREELIGMDASNVVDERIILEAEELQSKLEDGGTAHALQTELQTATGGAVPVEIRFTLFPTGDGEYGRVGVIRDVSEQRTLENQLRDERDLNQQIVETSLTGIIVSDRVNETVFSNARTQEILGLPDQELSSFQQLLSERTFLGENGAPVPESELPFLRMQHSREPIYGYELGIEKPDRQTLWLSVNGASVTNEQGEVTHRVFTFEDITEQRRRIERLASLNQLMRALTTAEASQEAADIAAAAARDALSLPDVVIALYDDETGTLQSVTQGADGRQLDATILGDHGRDIAWESFANGESKIYDDFAEATSAETPVEMRSVVVLPLGKHGVFITASPEPNAFSDSDIYLADILGSNLQSAFDRTEREQSLRWQRNMLRERTERLERLDRTNRIIRDITQALREATSREEIEGAVCAKIANSDPYRFAWIGRYDRFDDEITPVASAGAGQGYLDEIARHNETISGEQGPAGNAVRTREPQTIEHIRTAPPLEPWREAALRRGYRSVVAVPLVYGDTLHGVLSIYAGNSDVFDDVERRVLRELGETIGYALNALDRKRALVSKQSIELEYSIPRGASQSLGFIEHLGNSFEYENIVQRSDGRLHLFFSVRDTTADLITQSSTQSLDVESVRLITEHDGKYLYECLLARSSLLSSLLDRGVVVRSIGVDEHTVRLRIRVPSDANVRNITSTIVDTSPSAELVSKRKRDEPIMTRHEFESEFEQRLTERQRNVLQTAYFSGFFEWPRETTGQELAEILDVSQPTVNRHMRAGERKLFEMLFGER